MPTTPARWDPEAHKYCRLNIEIYLDNHHNVKSVPILGEVCDSMLTAARY